MRSIDRVGIAGGVLFLVGIVFGITDPKLFDHWYDWVLGPFFWMMGCTLIISWALGHMGLVPFGQRQGNGTKFNAAVATDRRHQERRQHERRKSAPVA